MHCFGRWVQSQACTVLPPESIKYAIVARTLGAGTIKSWNERGKVWWVSPSKHFSKRPYQFQERSAYPWVTGGALGAAVSSSPFYRCQELLEPPSSAPIHPHSSTLQAGVTRGVAGPRGAGRDGRARGRCCPVRRSPGRAHDSCAPQPRRRAPLCAA